MTRTRVTLVTAGIVAGALAAQSLIVGLWNTVFGYLTFGGPAAGIFSVSLVWTLLTGLLHYAAFGFGVFVTLRFVVPVGGHDSWRRTVTRGILATAVGAIAALVFNLIVSLIAAITIGAYPFGYSLDAGVDPNRIQYGVQNTLAGAITPLVEWLPLVVLACVFLKLWLGAHPALTETKDRASASV